MDYILSCEICQVDYDETTCVPIVTNCGHSFCLSCIKKICITSSLCPKCRKELDKKGNFPINYTLLNLIGECKSKKNLSQDLVCSIRGLKEKLSSRLSVFDREISEISKTRKSIEKDFKILEDLEKVKSGEEFRENRVREMLKEVQKRYEEISLKNLHPFEDAERYSNFSLKKSKSSDALLLEVILTFS